MSKRASEAECDGSMTCPATHHPPTCSFRRWQDREVEKELLRREPWRLGR